jgi:hypothetical protein
VRLQAASAQVRWTLVCEMPTAFAIVRTLQCVAFGGVSLAVFASTLSFTAGDGPFAGPSPVGKLASEELKSGDVYRWLN